MSIIWDSHDARAIGGKPISGVPLTGGYPLYINGQFRADQPGALIFIDDFSKDGGASLGANDVGEKNWINNGTGSGATALSQSVGSGPYSSSATTLVAPGFAQLSSGSTATGNYAFIRQGGGQWVPGDLGWTLTAVCLLGQTDANFDVAIGLTRTNSIGAGAGITANAIVVEKVGSDTSWYGRVTDGAGTSVRTSALIATSSSNWVCLQLRRVSAGVAGFKAASTLAGLETATEQQLSTNYPTGQTFYLGANITTRTAAQKTVYVDLLQFIIPGGITNR